MKLEEVTTHLDVRPADLDILGHVNNAAVLEYLEAGRWAWMDHHGVRRVHRVVPVVSRIEVRYLKEIPRAALCVRTALDDVPPDFEDMLTYRVTFRQAVLLAGDVSAAEARVEVAFLDAAERSLRSLQDFLAPTE